MTRTIPFPHKQYGMFPVEETLRDAAYRGNIHFINELQAKYPKLDLNAVNEYLETALYIACKRNQAAVVQYLLTCNVDVNVQTILGNTALLISAWNDNNPIAQMLVEHGANIETLTNPDRPYHGNVSAIDIARERGNTTLVSFLENSVNNTKTYRPSF